MARHDQKDPAKVWVCPECKMDNCRGCVDVLRSAFTDKKLCACNRPGHSGEGSRERSITCPRCHMTSYNINDVTQRYCGNCNMFLEDMDDLATATGPDGEEGGQAD